MTRLLQGVEAQYAAFRAIQSDGADDLIGRLAGALTVFFQLAPIAVTGLHAGPRAVLLAAGLGLLLAVFVPLDLRRRKLARNFWDVTWQPSVIQRFALALWLLVTMLAVAFLARVSLIGAFFLFVALGSLPLKKWIDQLDLMTRRKRDRG